MPSPHNEFTGPVESVVNAQQVGAINFHFGDRVLTPSAVTHPPADFTDRTDVLGLLNGIADPASLAMPRVVVITGPRGVGVSALIYRWVAENAHRFPGGNLQFDFQGEVTGGSDIGTAAEVFLSSLGVVDWAMPASTAARIRHYRTLTSQAPILVVLEGVTEPAQVRALVPNAAGSVVLVAAAVRDESALEELTIDSGAQVVRLRPLSNEHSHLLLSRLVGNEPYEQDRLAADQIVQACHGMPIALRAVAGICRSRQWSLAEVAAALYDDSRLAAVRQAEADVTAVFDVAFANLPAGARDLAVAVGQIPGADFAVETAAVAVDVSNETATRALSRLREAGLLYENAGRFYLHDEFRAYLRGKGTDGVLRRVLDRQMAIVAYADDAITHQDRLRGFDLRRYLDRLPDPFDGTKNRAAAASRWLRDEHLNLLQTEREISDRGWHREVAEFAVMMGGFNYNVRSLTAFEEWTTLGIASARQIGAAEIEARLLMMRSSVHHDRRDLDRMRADVEKALDIARRLEKPDLLGSALEYVGRYVQQTGDLTTAGAAFRDSISWWQREGHERGEGIAHYRYGVLLTEAGDLPGALKELRTAITMLTGIKDQRMAGRARIASGVASAKSGDLWQARAALREAMETFDRLDIPHYQAQAMEKLAKLVEPAESLRLLRSVQAIYLQALHPDADDVTKEIDRRTRTV